MMSELKREYENVKRKKFHYSHYKVNDQFIDLMADFNEEFRTTGFKISKPVRKSLRCLTERTLLKKFAPAAVVVDELGNILFIHGRTGMFLELRPGSLGISNVLKMSRVGMRRELRLALKEAITHQKIVYTPGLSIQAFGEHLLVNLTVGPLENYTQEPALYIIIFENGTKGQSQRSANVDERYPINFDEKKNIQVDKDEYKDVLKIERMIISKSKELSEIENELKTNKKMFEMSQRELQNLGEMVDNAKNDIEMNEKLEFNKSELGHSDQLLKAANKELQIVNEKLALGQSELDNNDRRLEKGKEELEILNEKFTFIKSELINKSQLLESAKDEFKNVKEKVASCKNELRINNNLLENLKNEIESVRIELDSVRVELKKENGLPELLKQKLESIKSELKLLKIELKETNNELYSANNQLQRTNEEIEDSKLLLNSMKKELATTLSKIRENRFNDKVLTLFNDEEPTNDKQYTLFSNKGDAIENVHSLFNNQEAVIEDSQTRNIEDKPLLTKSKNNDNSIKLPGINTIQFHFRDKYENEPSQINDGDRKIDNAEVESSQLGDKNNLNKFMLSDDPINSSELITTDREQLNQKLMEAERERSILAADTMPTMVADFNEEAIKHNNIMMNLQEWFLMLAKVEEDGAELYKKFSEFSSRKLKSVILGFAQEEFKHKRLMIDLSSDYQFSGIQLNETLAMLSQQQADYVANNSANINLTSEKEFLQFALQLEKNYIEIYKRQLDIFEMDSNEYKRFKNMIEEASIHMVFIENMLNDLK